MKKLVHVLLFISVSFGAPSISYSQDIFEELVVFTPERLSKSDQKVFARFLEKQDIKTRSCILAQIRENYRVITKYLKSGKYELGDYTRIGFIGEEYNIVMSFSPANRWEGYSPGTFCDRGPEPLQTMQAHKRWKGHLPEPGGLSAPAVPAAPARDYQR